MPQDSFSSRLVNIVLVLLATLVFLISTPLAVAQDDALLDAQRTLSKRGYNPGPADGLMGPRTKLALQNFQRDAGLITTGFLDPETNEALTLNIQPAPPSHSEYFRAENGSWWPWIFFIVVAYGVVRLVRRGTHRWWGMLIGGTLGYLIGGPVGVLIGVVLGSFLGNSTRQRGSARILKEAGSSASRRTTVRSVPKVRNATKGAARWIEPDGMVTIAGRKIGGMIYIGSGSRQDRWKTEGGSFIDPSLRVARIGSDFSGDSMPYWPSYNDINPQTRATYLDWLAGGRSDKRLGPGYVFLYFYGLEKRFFADSPAKQEKRLLVTEVKRLLGIYGENHSVRRYLKTFLDVAQTVLEPVIETEPRLDESGYELSLGLRVAIGRMAKESQPLAADCLLRWYISHPETSLRTPATRAFPEFRALFKLFFDERFPKGLKMRTPKRLLRARYTAASGAFEVDLTPLLGDIPDISGTTKPLTIAKELVEEASDALDKYSRFLGRNPEGRKTIEAHALLPERLWPLFPCAEMDDLRRWAEKIIEKGGLTPIEQTIERLEGVPPEKIGKRQLTGAADALARLSIGLAPDPRFALRSPKLGEPVVLFRLPKEITALEEVSEKYKEILVTIAIGSFVAHADGTIATRERDALQARVNAARLSEVERARLLANLQWMSAIPPDLALFRRRLKDIPEGTRHELGQVALAMAAVDGAIDPAEIKAIEALYKAIGLTTDGVYSDLHALTARSEPVTVRPPRDLERGFGIPPPPISDGKVVLDAERVASVMANTARVSSVLGNIFDDDELDEDQEETAEVSQSSFPGLDAQHAAFLGELLTRRHWEEAEFATLADQFRLMQAGALETLNEWSFDRFGDVLIEEYDGYEFNPDVEAEVRN